MNLNVPFRSPDGSGTLQERYLDGPTTDEVLARTSGSGVTAWYLSDNEGSVRDIVSSSGTELDHVAYDAYGNVISESSPSNGDRFKYNGMQFDQAIGAYYDNARYYDPVSGRFLEQDPTGFAAGDPNLSRFAGNSPTNGVDRSGLDGQTPAVTPQSMAAPLPDFTNPAWSWTPEQTQALADQFKERFAQLEAEGTQIEDDPVPDFGNDWGVDELRFFFLAKYGSQGAGLLQAALENGFIFETDQNYWGFNKIWFFNWNWGEPNQIVINHSMGLPTSVEALHEALESQFGNSFLSGLFGKLNLSGPQVRFIIEHPNLFDGSTVTQMVDARDRGRYFVNSLGNGFVRTAKNKAQEYAAATVGQAVATAVAGIVQRLAKLKQAKKAIAEAAEAANNAKAPNAGGTGSRNYVFRGDNNYRGGPVGKALGADADAATIQSFADHVLRKESGMTSRFTSFTTETKVAKKFTSGPDLRNVTKAEMDALRSLEASGQIKIHTPESVYEAMKAGPKKVSKEASAVRDAMKRNGEILIEGQIPDGILQGLN